MISDGNYAGRCGVPLFAHTPRPGVVEQHADKFSSKTLGELGTHGKHTFVQLRINNILQTDAVEPQNKVKRMQLWRIESFR